MGRRLLSSASFGEVRSEADDCELDWPFGGLDAVDRDELRETAYEIFFTSCRSAPGFAGRSALNLSPADEGAAAASKPEKAAPGGGGTQMVVKSRIKRSLGLRTRRVRAMTHMGSAAAGGGGGGGTASPVKVKRPMTSAEIMRQQMGVTEQNDNRLRKTLTRSLVGQTNKKVETIVLPLELLRHLKPSEFNDAHEYHQWQRRQLKILEVGLLLHPSVPLDQKNAAAVRLREIVRSTELKAIDTSKNSEAMRALNKCVGILAWRNPNNSPMEACHWADGYPLNIHIYLSLLRSIFDLRDETVVLDEVDELVELMKKTWPTLGINRMIHNVCFTWVLFEQYVMTGQVEPDLITATLAMLVEVANDAKRPDREPGYVRVLSATLASMQGWAERKLLDYHQGFEDGAVAMMENVLCLALSTAKMRTEDISCHECSPMLVERRNKAPSNSFSGNRVDHYIKSSIKNAFTRIFENGNGRADSMIVEVEEDPSEILMQLIRETENLAMVEKETYSPILKKWHPVPTAVALVTLHNCFGIVLKQCISRITGLTNELVRVLQTATKLEKVLVQMVVEDAADCDDGGKGIIKEMTSYDVDTIILNLMRAWIDERLKIGRQCVNRAKDNENWNPKSKTEPYAQSAVDLMKLAKVTVEEFFEIQVGARDELVQVLADGLESLVQEYTSFIASCGTKQSYVPALPPLTRCNQDSVLLQLWKKAAAPCQAGMDACTVPVKAAGGGGGSSEQPNKPRSSTSRGTQRLYVRLNTLHYILALLHSIDKSLSFFSRASHSPSPRRTPLGNHQYRRRIIAPTHFDLARTAIHAAILQVSEIAAYRLIFADSASNFYNSLYAYSVAESRIQPTLRALKQNLNLLVAVLTDRAQPGAVREVMKVCFECFLTVLLAGGPARAFTRSDYEMVVEDFGSLKRVFCSSGEGLVAEDVVEKEAAPVEAVVALMGLPTEQLVEDFIMMASKAGMAFAGGQRMPMPPTTRKWNRSDPNTVLRVLCHRDDDVANRFLKKTFQLPKRR
ncbi:protein unc-13 [Cocos nucifera]|uniref:Protein unc-13 n=1 Tax=Cocos nucifera TaxID=13894 RepID=A0A8K0N895_COCNU|nr:protein unc-13 [Cocos nucifera]